MGWTTHYDEALPFVANAHSLVHGPGRQIDWAAAGDIYGGDAFVVEAAATADATDEAIVVAPLPGPIPAGAVLYFGTGKFARLTADAAADDEALEVEALENAITDGDTAVYYPGKQPKAIPAGTIMAELDSGKLVPRAVSGADTATHILESTASESDVTGHAGYGVLVGGVIFSNLLPDAGAANFSTWLGELAAAGVGTGWHWSTYADNTAS